MPIPNPECRNQATDNRQLATAIIQPMIADKLPASTLDAERRAASEQTFVRILAIISAALAAIPDLFNWLLKHADEMTYLGVQYNLDDHMVYAAWMRQAMDGRFLFDNRFTTDAQPGLTIHLYFLLLGWVAKVVGIPLAMSLSRIGFSAAFVYLLYRLVRRVCPDTYTTKLAMSLAVVGGGIGCLIWSDFGRTIQPPLSGGLQNLFLGLLPTDVWQPEGYVFPSMLTNGLFMASLCLIVASLLAFLSAKDDWKWVLHGSVAMFLLMNIHSYDVLLIAFVMAGLLVMAIVQRQLTAAWLLRSIVIALGAVPSALWFVYVLQKDAVFQARAATPTFTANFRQVVFGYLLLMILGLVALALRQNSSKRQVVGRSIGFFLATALFVGMFIAGASHPGDGYFMSLAVWLACMACAFVVLALVSDQNAAWNLVASWALLGTIAPYFPALFERKLSMGLAIPWAILAAIAVGALTRRLDRSTRNLALILTICLIGASSIRWFRREFELAALDVSNTTTHPVYLGIDETQILKMLNDLPGRKVVLAMPGIPMQDPQSPGRFYAPYLPDLNPILSGMSGVYTYAGHWSETPDYNRKRSLETQFFLKGFPDDKRQAFLKATQADYIVAPVPQTYTQIPLEDLSGWGEIIFSGLHFKLVRVR